MLGVIRKVAAFFPVRTWLIIGLAVALLGAALWLYLAGRDAGGDAVRDDVAAAARKSEARASTGRETASTERQLDTAAITDRQMERDHEAEQTPDSVPDDRELRRRCRQLRDAGRGDLPACRGLAG